MTLDQILALRLIAQAVLESIKAAGPLGAPGGHLYAALMAHGCSLQQFEQIMTGLERNGMVTKRGDCYHATAKGFNGVVAYERGAK